MNMEVGDCEVEATPAANSAQMAPSEPSQHPAVDGLILLDAEWRCIRTIGDISNLLHRPECEISGRVVWHLLRETLDTSTYEQWRQGLQARKPIRLGPHRTMDGRRVASLFLPDTAGGFLCFVDVTELDCALEQMNVERRRVDDFLAVLAHELRNPLASLCTGVAVLEVAAAQPDRQRVLELLRRHLRSFVRLVEDLVDVSTIVRGRMQLHRERCNVQALIRYVVACSRPLADDKQQRIEIGPVSDGEIDGDVTRLEQVLINLLRNAVANTEPGGRIYIEAPDRDNLVNIRVKDTGRGIPVELVPFLFQPPYSDVGALARPGGGIGLGVVRRIVELHGGSVTAHSGGIGQGSEFVVSLPKAG
jgi:two-component system CheB/CheR fusion protein